MWAISAPVGAGGKGGTKKREAGSSSPPLMSAPGRTGRCRWLQGKAVCMCECAFARACVCVCVCVCVCAWCTHKDISFPTPESHLPVPSIPRNTRLGKTWSELCPSRRATSSRARGPRAASSPTWPRWTPKVRAWPWKPIRVLPFTSGDGA